MTVAALERLDAAATGLRDAMEAGDTDKIESAMSGFGAAVGALRAIGAWRTDPEIKEQLRRIMARLESHHILSRLLGDLTRQRLDLLAVRTTATAIAPATYRRPV